MLALVDITHVDVLLVAMEHCNERYLAVLWLSHIAKILVDLCINCQVNVSANCQVNVYAGFALYFTVCISCLRLCCALDKLCALCIWLPIKSTTGHMPSVTVILFKRIFKLCEIFKLCHCPEEIHLGKLRKWASSGLCHCPEFAHFQTQSLPWGRSLQ